MKKKYPLPDRMGVGGCGGGCNKILGKAFAWGAWVIQFFNSKNEKVWEKIQQMFWTRIKL